MRRLADGVAEIKRMYVRPADRSRGVAAALLAALEEEAVALGYTVARLDTGPKQVQAQRLYRRMGYVEVAGVQRQPLCLLLGEKRLA